LQPTAPLNRPGGRLWRVWLAVTRPWPACLIFNATLLVWHVPALYNTTLTVVPLHIFEHLTFIAVGIVFWWPIVDPVSRPGRARIGPLEKIAMLGVAGVPPTLLRVRLQHVPARVLLVLRGRPVCGASIRWPTRRLPEWSCSASGISSTSSPLG
jgi:cytochrome c oxidase assembly factor CtaG